MDKDQFVADLKTLVAFETLTGNVEENKKALDFVVSKISPRAKVKRFKNKTTEILIIGNKDILNPDFAYLVHMDVVAAKPEQFKLMQKEDKLMGRGASDMKFSIPIGIELLNKLIDRNSQIAFSLVITTDEEVGGFDGSFYLANNFNFRPKNLIVPDGGDNLVFVNKSKGVCQLIIEYQGFPAHASRPWDGKNALEPIIKLANELIKRYGKNNEKETWKTTMNIGQIQGGISTNQVCPDAVMKLDFRFPETDNRERIVEEVEELAKKIDIKIKISPASFGSPTFTDKNLSIVKLFIKSLEEEINQKIVVKETYGASDARHFSQLNIPVLMIKPIGGDIHCDTEWVSLTSCMKFYSGLKNFLEKYEGSANI